MISKGAQKKGGWDLPGNHLMDPEPEAAANCKLPTGHF